MLPRVQQERPETNTYDAPKVDTYDDEVATQPSSSDSLGRSVMNTHGVPVTAIPDEDIAKQQYSSAPATATYDEGVVTRPSNADSLVSPVMNTYVAPVVAPAVAPSGEDSELV